MRDIGAGQFRLACRVVGWLMVLAVTVLSLMPVAVDLSEGRDKWSHWLAYAALMWWFSMLHRRRMPLALALVAMGVLIECLQGLTGYRSFDVHDMLANALGVISGWALAPTPAGRLLQWLQDRLFAGR